MAPHGTHGLLGTPDDMNPKPKKDTFVKPKQGGVGGKPGGGRGGATPGTPAEAEAEPEAMVEPPKPKPEEPKVMLSNLKWGEQKPIFNEKISVSVQGVVPDEIAHLSRIEFKLVALPPDGKREEFRPSQNGNLVGGKATAEFTLFIPAYRDAGKLPDECKYVFTAKHSKSKEEESAPITAKKRFATNVRFERDEGWMGAPVKVMADTGLADDTEVTLKITLKTEKAIEVKVKAKAGKLEYAWSPCLCGVRLVAGALPAETEASAEYSLGTDKEAAKKTFKLKLVIAADAKTFSQDYTWSGFGVHSEFTQKIEGGVHKVHVKKKVRKGWYGTYVNMSRAAGITGRAGYPRDKYRWAKTDGVGELPTKYHNGTAWVDMPAGFVPTDSEYWNATFAKEGTHFELRGRTGVNWPEAFADYDFNKTAYAKKRADWIKDTHDRFTEKALLRPKCCPKGVDDGGCGYKLELTLEFEVVTTWEAHSSPCARGIFVPTRRLFPWKMTTSAWRPMRPGIW